MNFRITGFDDIGSHTHYSVNKGGEHYTVYTMFSEPLQAYKMLEKIFLCVVFGMYADKERMNFIEKEIMKREGM